MKSRTSASIRSYEMKSNVMTSAGLNMRDRSTNDCGKKPRGGGRINLGGDPGPDLGH